MTSCFALYRLPGEETAIRIAAARAKVFPSCEALNGQQGFVIAPFTPSEKEPVLLIEPEEISSFVPKSMEFKPYEVSISGQEKARNLYGNNFQQFHDQLLNGTFRKIVLARQKELTCDREVQSVALFNRACALYPQQMVVLVSAPQCGTWLMATPEILLQGHGTQWRTMALAGTMPANKENAGWSVKNIREQRLVSTYISQCLEKYATNIDLRGPMTAQAGALIHLKSEFTFALKDNEKVGNLLDALYPTPAVCGIPKDATREFITANENIPRGYYSGFMGPLNMNGNSDLYVSLRCMRIEGNTCYLHAGGGLITDSIEQQEWDETEAKMGTMLSCLREGQRVNESTGQRV